MNDLSDLSLRQKKIVALSIMIVGIFFMFVGWYCGSMSTYEDAYWEGESAGYHHGQFSAYDTMGYLHPVTINNLTEDQGNDVRFYKNVLEQIEVFTIAQVETVPSLKGCYYPEKRYDYTYSLILDPDYSGDIYVYSDYSVQDDDVII